VNEAVTEGLPERSENELENAAEPRTPVTLIPLGQQEVGVEMG